MSAILPVRNPGPDLAGSIEAIRSTLSVDDELIVVDDGSTDVTPVLLRDTDWGDLRTTVITSAQHAGVASARNLVSPRPEGRWCGSSTGTTYWSSRSLSAYMRRGSPRAHLSWDAGPTCSTRAAGGASCSGRYADPPC